MANIHCDALARTEYLTFIFRVLSPETTKNIFSQFLNEAKSCLFQYDSQCTDKIFKEKMEILNLILEIMSNLSETDGLHFCFPEDRLNLQDIVKKCTLVLKNDKENSKCYSDVCDLLKFSLLLLQDEEINFHTSEILTHCQKQFSSLAEGTFIADGFSNKYRTESSSLSASLSLFEIVITVLPHVEAMYFHTFNELKQQLHEKGFLNNFIRLFTNISKPTIEQILIHIFPKLVSCVNHNYLLSQLWDILSLHTIDVPPNKISLTNSVTIISVLSEFYLPLSESSLSFSIVEDKKFWKLCQMGLIYDDLIVRKQALYLSKRAIDIISQNKMGINNSGNSLFQSILTLKDAEFCGLWNDIFLILETLEEKQVHIIKPVLPLLLKLTENTSLFVKPWVLCLFHRLLNHDNNSVVKWGIIHMNNIDLEFFASQYDECSVALLQSVVKSLNNTSLYGLNSNKFSDLPEVVESLLRLFYSISQLDNRISELFFTNFLSALVLQRWGPVPLFYVIHALSTLSNINIWDDKCLLISRNLIQNTISNQNIYIRGAVQVCLLKTIFKLSDTKQISLKVVSNFLGNFNSKESLRRGTRIWSECVAWLKSFVKKDEVCEYVVESLASVTLDDIENEVKANTLTVNTRSLARFIVLLMDAEVLSSDELRGIECNTTGKAFYRLWEAIDEHSEYRLYISDSLQQFAIKMLSFLLEESSVTDNPVDDFTRRTVLEIFKNSIYGTFICLKRHLLFKLKLQDYDSINSYIQVLESFIQDCSMLPFIADHIYILQDSALNILQNGAENLSSVNLFFGMQIVSWISKCLKLYSVYSCYIEKSKVGMKHFRFISEFLISNKLNQMPLKQSSEWQQEASEVQKLWGKLTCGYLEAVWTVLSMSVHVLNTEHVQRDFLGGDMSTFIEFAAKAIEIGGIGVSVPVMRTVKIIIQHRIYVESLSQILSFLSMCWKNIFEIRWTEYFRCGMEIFIELLFQTALIREKQVHIHLLQYSHEIFELGKSVSGVANILLMKLQHIDLDSKIFFASPLCEILVEGLLYGTSHRRDLRLESQTCSYIRSLGEEFSMSSLSESEHGSDGQVRVRALQILLEMSLVDKVVPSKIAEMLLEKNNVSLRKPRYFADSQHHRLKNRIMQVLLVLEPYLDFATNVNLSSWLYESLFVENQQPSVRYQQEWLLVRILHDHKGLRDDMWQRFKEASEKRTGSMCSFIAVLFHLARIIDDRMEQEKFIDKSMEEIFPACMGQHFSVRLYAQVVLKKLWELSQQYSFRSILKKYFIMQASLEMALSQGNSVKNVEKLLNDFYFCIFHPINHYTFETVFHDLPRLSNISCEEWITVQTLKYCRICSSSSMPLENTCDKLRTCNNVTYVSRFAEHNENDEPSKDGSFNVQKKIIPWKFMLPDPKSLSSMPEAIQNRKKAAADGGLIVVSSLIDRTPNLGGLCRTCEVFGVSQYVIGSLKYTEDKQFQSLNVSADRWIPITEVKPHMLHQYLLLVKKDGYTVIGAEQTSNSKKLSNFIFPKKSLLLLGNEKEGIPPNLLPLMDVCVEIPQHGVTRSLNVHVTGAVFIWEYVRQMNIRL